MVPDNRPERIQSDIVIGRTDKRRRGRLIREL
jgi:hypothetical protein